MQPQDPGSAERKKDHIELAFSSVVEAAAGDRRFYYEPLLAAHPLETSWQVPFLGKTMRLPLWVSSMTGGTALAGTINRNLAMACAEFGMGMGLGSCRNLLYSNDYFDDFNVRDLIGNDLPFYANLGIAQVEQLLARGETDRMSDLVSRLRTDGLIVHVNPLQEWLQPEGDRFQHPPIETLEQLLELVDFPIIVKEVGQGMGPQSLLRLMHLPLAAIDFGALGGTNFARLELLRANKSEQELFNALSNNGHDAVEMIHFVNEILNTNPARLQCTEMIVSGGIKHFLDGYYGISKLQCTSVYAQGSAFLQHARGDYAALREYVAAQARGLLLAKAFLKVR